MVDEIYWTLNEKSKTLQCQFSGVPRPVKVEWRKDNQVEKSNCIQRVERVY